MIVEERIYRMKPGKAPEYVKAYADEGLAIQRPILGNLVGYYTTEIGPLNVVVHLWAYEDMVDRAARRAKLSADARWRDYLPKVSPFVEQQENRIFTPAPFFEPMLRTMLASVKA